MAERMSPAERKEYGRSLREAVPRSSHAEWTAPSHRPDPVDLLVAQDETRLPWLVPIRHGRMAVSPFTFYRGSATIMASDLAATPVTGLQAQICGDAHLSNFGTFASPERRQVFDVNDFDETLPGPWEWDLKRLATSFVLAGRDNGYDDARTRTITQASVAAYRTAMAKLAEASTLEAWYFHLTLDDIFQAFPKKKDRARIEKGAAKARSKDSLRAVSRLTHRVDGVTQIKSQPPLLVPLRHLAADDQERLQTDVDNSLARYRTSLADNHKFLLDRYRIVDIALKVVGVGSVGTRCMVVFMAGKDEGDPLFLQIKEATESVLEAHLPKSVYDHHGERVVKGQRLTQAASDIFLGWSIGDLGHHFYWRQFHDMKGSAEIGSMSARRLEVYAKLCGWTLAHAHARSGDAIAISGYLGKGSVFDEAVTEFAFAYHDQNQADYDAFAGAIASGRIAAEED